MYSLINEIADTVDLQDYIIETINEVFKDEVTELYEGAEHYLGQAIAALQSGKNPFEDGHVDPHVVSALILLSNPEHREAFNISPAKFAVIDHVDKSDKVRRFLTHKVGSSPAGKNVAQRLMQTSSENPKAAARELQKAQMAFAGAEQKFQQSQQQPQKSSLAKFSDDDMKQAHADAAEAGERRGIVRRNAA